MDQSYVRRNTGRSSTSHQGEISHTGVTSLFSYELCMIDPAYFAYGAIRESGIFLKGGICSLLWLIFFHYSVEGAWGGG